MFFNYMVIPLKTGTYIAFDVPAGTEDEVGVYITMCRENAIWHKRMYRLNNFFDFFLYSNDDPAKAGEYYMHYD